MISPLQAIRLRFIAPMSTLRNLGTALAVTAVTCCASGVSSLDQAFERLRSYEANQNHGSLAAIVEEARAAANDPAARSALERRLLDVLKSPAPAAAKQFACRQLGVVGTQDSVAILEPLLRDPELSHAARFALERIPGKRSGEALVNALPSLQGSLQVGVINSLGEMRFAAATRSLAKYSRVADSLTADAAILALGSIGTAEALEVLAGLYQSASAAQKATVAEAFLMAAGRKAGPAPAGARAFLPAPKLTIQTLEQIYRDETPGSLRFGAFRILVVSAPAEGATRLLLESLRADDPAVRHFASTIIRSELPAATLKPVLAGFRNLPVQGQLAVLDALRERQETIGRETARQALESSEVEVRVAALRALAMLGDTSDLPELLRRAAAETSAEPEAQAARFALASIPGKETDAWLTRQLEMGGPDSVLLLHALAARHSPGATQAILSRLKEAGPARHAALDALGALGNEEHISPIVPLLRDPDSQTRAKAERTLELIVARTAARSLDELKNATASPDPATRAVIVRQFGAVAGPRALAMVRSALEDSDPVVRDAAFNVLVEWPGTGALPDLLEFAKTSDDPARRTLAFRGYVRLCRDGEMPAEQRIKNLSQAAALAGQPQEKLQVISALGNIPDPRALSLLEQYLQDSGLSEAAGLAVLNVTGGLDPKHREQAISILEKVSQSPMQDALKERANSELKRFRGQT
jgi:HEAT repeat protein